VVLGFSVVGVGVDGVEGVGRSDATTSRVRALCVRGDTATLASNRWRVSRMRTDIKPCHWSKDVGVSVDTASKAIKT